MASLSAETRIYEKLSAETRIWTEDDMSNARGPPTSGPRGFGEGFALPELGLQPRGGANNLISCRVMSCTIL